MTKRKAKSKQATNNVVIVSDLHCGCRFGLCPEQGIAIDGGGTYKPSRVQVQVWRRWQFFWREWVPDVCHGEPYDVVINGDAIDGRHHNATTQFTNNLADQVRVAYEILAPIREKAQRMFLVRGTEAHVGPSGESEEDLGAMLDATPDEQKMRSRHELRLRVGKGLVDIQHHIGCTGSQYYESTAVQKELIDACIEASRWGEQVPDIVVRSHRHRMQRNDTPSAKGKIIGIVTPGWQLKTPFIFRTNMRQSVPQVGGIAIRQGDMDLYAREKVWSLKRAKVTT